MIAEAITKLNDLFTKGGKVTVSEHHHRPRHYLVEQNGEHAWVEKDDPIKKVAVDRLDDLVRFLKPHGNSAEVYVAGDQVVGLLDADDRRDEVRVPLRMTERWLQLARMSGDWQAFEPAGMSKLLRELGADSTTRAALSKIDFKRTNESGGAARHGSESLGRSVEATAQNAEDIPEEFFVETAVYHNAGCDMSVRVQVEVYLDTLNQRTMLRTTVDDMTTLQQQVLAKVTADLDDGRLECDVFRGEPS